MAIGQFGVSIEEAAYSVAEDVAKIYRALGSNSFAVGSCNKANGEYSYAQGYNNYNKTEKIEGRNIEERWEWLDDDTDE